MRTNVHVAIISVLAVCMLLTNVPFAFADSSSSSVIESQENGVSGDYFVVDLFKYVGAGTAPAEAEYSESDFTPIAQADIPAGEISYAPDSGNTKKTIPIGKYDLLSGNVYIAFLGSADAEYIPQLDVVLRENGVEIPNGGDSVYASTIEFGSGEYSLQTGMAYKLVCAVNFLSAYDLSYSTESLGVAYTLVSVNIVNGSSVSALGCNVTLAASSAPVDYIHTDSDHELVVTDYTSGGKTYEAVNVVGSDGRSPVVEGKLDVTVSVDSGKHFALYMTKGKTPGHTYVVNITVKVGTTVYNTDANLTEWPESNPGRYYGHQGSNVKNYTFGQIKNDVSRQFYSANEDIEITIKGVGTDLDPSFRIKLIFID